MCYNRVSVIKLIQISIQLFKQEAISWPTIMSAETALMMISHTQAVSALHLRDKQDVRVQPKAILRIIPLIHVVLSVAIQAEKLDLHLLDIIHLRAGATN